MTQDEQQILDELYRRKLAHEPYAAYCTASEPLGLKYYTGRWVDGKPEMRDVSIDTGTTLRIVMVSRLGDIGLTEHLEAAYGYGIRLPLDSEKITRIRWTR
jgi:hypothetical protein